MAKKRFWHAALVTSVESWDDLRAEECARFDGASPWSAQEEASVLEHLSLGRSLYFSKTTQFDRYGNPGVVVGSAADLALLAAWCKAEPGREYDVVAFVSLSSFSTVEDQLSWCRSVESSTRSQLTLFGASVALASTGFCEPVIRTYCRFGEA